MWHKAADLKNWCYPCRHRFRVKVAQSATSTVWGISNGDSVETASLWPIITTDTNAVHGLAKWFKSTWCDPDHSGVMIWLKLVKVFLQ